MKEQIVSFVEGLKSEGHDFINQPVLCKWGYPEYPKMEFQLLIKELEDVEINLLDEDHPHNYSLH